MTEKKYAANNIALALSGGGFRATLFHLGSLYRLNEIGLLPEIKSISSISGGSITGCYLGLNWKDLRFNGNGTAENFRDVIVDPLRKFCSKDIDTYPTLINMFLMLFGGVSSALAGQYKKHLYGSNTLADLPTPDSGPDFIFLSSNIQTNGRVWFSRERLWAERLGVLESPEIPLATVIAASSGLPPFLSPVILITNPAEWKREDNSDLFDDPDLRGRMILADGGIHDPSGVDPIFENHDTILVSDANVTNEVWRTPSSFWIRQTGRSTILQTVSNREIRRRLLERCSCADKSGVEKTVIWWASTDRIDEYGIDDPLTLDNEKTKALGAIRTRLGRFSPVEQCRLINWGYALCDAALRKNNLIETSTAPQPEWPEPEFAL